MSSDPGAMSRVYFHEDQYFRGSFLWATVFAVPVVVAIVALTASPRMTVEAIGVTLAVAAVLTAIFAFTRLETEVRSDSVVVRFHNLWPTRTIPIADILMAEPCHYTILDSGGWGVHLGLAGMTYNVSGNEGVALRLRGGDRVLIGSQRADDLAGAIAEAVSAAGGTPA